MTNLNSLFLSIAAFFLSLSTDHIETTPTNNCEELVTGMWQLQSNVPTLENLSSVYFPNVNEGWAVGGEGTILNTTDGGITWTSQTSGTEAFLHSVAFIDNQVGYAVGFPNSNGVENLLHTTNGGTTWSNSSPSAFTNYYAVDIIDFGNGAIVGSNNFPSEGVTVQLLGTTNFNYRTPVPMGVNTELRGVDFVDTGGGSATGYAVGDGGVIIKTTSGGMIWSSVPSLTTDLLGVSFVDENIGWAVGSGGTIFHTVDGANNWVSQTSGTRFALNDVHFVDENNGWAVGNGGVLLRTVDGGSTWNFEDIGITKNLNGIYFTDIDNGWVVGRDGTVLKYSNTIVPVEYLFFDGQIKDEKVILSWASASEINNEGFEVQRSSDGNKFSKVGWVQGNGNSTERHTYTFTDNAAKPNTTYYYRLKQMDMDGTEAYSEIRSISLIDKSRFNISEAFPNPTSHDTNFEVNMPEAGAIELSVFDLKGRVIKSQTTHLAKGTSSIRLQTTDSPSGQYYVKLQAARAVEYRKLLVQ